MFIFINGRVLLCCISGIFGSNQTLSLKERPVEWRLTGAKRDTSVNNELKEQTSLVARTSCLLLAQIKHLLCKIFTPTCPAALSTVGRHPLKIETTFTTARPIRTTSMLIFTYWCCSGAGVGWWCCLTLNMIKKL